MLLFTPMPSASCAGLTHLFFFWGMVEGSVVNEEVEMLRWMVYYSGMEEKKPHWIHDEATDSTSVTGKKYLISCTCSECGYHANMEKPVCPQCKARMKA